MKKKKLVKEALKHPEMYAPAELSFFSRWLQHLKEEKEKKKGGKKKLERDLPA
jgi:hypothetical protein